MGDSDEEEEDVEGFSLLKRPWSHWTGGDTNTYWQEINQAFQCEAAMNFFLSFFLSAFLHRRGSVCDCF